jgi:hypothetical protein
MVMLTAALAGFAYLSCPVQASAAKFRVWVADALVKVLPTTAAPPGSAASMRVDAVRNEYESAQFVVTAVERIQKMTVRVGEMTGPAGPKPATKVDFVGFVPIRKGTKDTPPENIVARPPADIPDPLMDWESAAVEAGRNQPVWVVVYVPKTCVPGTYRCRLEIDADGNRESVPLAIHVHAAVLPDQRTLKVTNWLYGSSLSDIARHHHIPEWSDAYWRMLEVYARFIAQYRQNVILTPLFTLISGKSDAEGNLSFDFARFDRWVEMFLKAGVDGAIEGYHLGGRSEWEGKDFDGNYPMITNPDGSVRKPALGVKVTSEQYRKFLAQFLPALQNHLDKRGWTKIYLQHLCDEPIAPNAESYKKLYSCVKQYAPKLRTLDACICVEIAGSIDVWVPVLGFYDMKRDFFAQRQKLGEEVWYYTCLIPTGKYMNRFVDYPLIDVRLLHWANFKYGVTGYLHWGLASYYEKPFDDLEIPMDPPHGHMPPGDSHIIYPGRNGPLSSIRFEAMRDGLEDYELLRLLAARDPKAAASICDRVVPSLTDYTRDPQFFRNARLELIEKLEK